MRRLTGLGECERPDARRGQPAGAIVTADQVTGTVEEPVQPADDTGRPRSWRRLTWLVLGASGAWLAFVAAHLLLSGRIWWWNLPDLAPPLVFLAVPVLLLAALPLARFARWAVAASAVAALALGWPVAGVNAAALWHRPPPAPPDAITVFSWNTWYWDQLLRTGPRGEPIRDPERFYRYLRAQAADVYRFEARGLPSSGGR
ncbi:hypothetical protein ABGB16_31265 [Micromonospora sp. B11E3]|uniref:hypothetical protein n=1 Tax=Micromonospora sp. B11E3 TaxID=3153562 RepID=UPI00325EF298